MKPLEYGVWYCDHPDCQVLIVLFNFPGTYHIHGGTEHLYFSLEEARRYLTGRQSLVQLVESKLQRRKGPTVT